MRELKVAGKSESLLTSLVERAYIPVVAILALVQAGFQVEILEIYPKLPYYHYFYFIKIHFIEFFILIERRIRI